MANPPNRIAALRKERKLSQQALADKLGTHWVTLSKLERGIQRLTWPWMERIAAALDVAPSRLIVADENIATVWIAGILAEDGEISEYEDDQMDKRLVFSSIFDEVYNDWYEIRGDTLWPFFKKGDLIGCTKIDGFSSIYLNRLVVFVDTDNRWRVGVVTQGTKPDLYNLQIGSGRPLIDIRGEVTHYVATAIFEAPLIAPDKVIINKVSQNDIGIEYEAQERRMAERNQKP